MNASFKRTPFFFYLFYNGTCFLFLAHYLYIKEKAYLSYLRINMKVISIMHASSSSFIALRLNE